MSGSFTERDVTDDEVSQEPKLRVNTQPGETGEKHMSHSASPYQKHQFANILPESPSYSEIQQRKNQGERNRFPLPVSVSNISPSNKENTTISSNEQKKGDSAFNKLFENQNTKFKMKVRKMFLFNVLIYVRDFLQEITVKTELIALQ